MISRNILLLEINRTENELQILLNSPNLLKKWERIGFLRSVLQDTLLLFTMKELKYCQVHNVDQKIWKITFYNVIELLRNQYSVRAKEPSLSAVSGELTTYRNLLTNVLDEGVAFYKELLNTLEKSYNFEIKDFLSSEDIKHGLGYVGLALMAVQKIFIYLGDLERYRASLILDGDKQSCSPSVCYKIAKKYYLNSTLVNPRNGRPFNQLAVLSLHERKMFDALYYYVRSLCASNPVLTAKNSLLTVCDDTRKSYESHFPLKPKTSTAFEGGSVNPKQTTGGYCDDSIRREVWVHPAEDGSSVHDEDDDSRSLSAINKTNAYCIEENEVGQATKRFISSYVYIHSKLFLRVDMDDAFVERAVHMLNQFNALTKFRPLPLDRDKFLQMTAVNVFSVYNWKDKSSTEAAPNCALIIFLQMMSSLLKQANALLKNEIIPEWRKTLDCANSALEDVDVIIDEDVKTYMAVITVCCEWLQLHLDVWDPLPDCRKYCISGGGSDHDDCWATQFDRLSKTLEDWNYQRLMEERLYKRAILLNVCIEDDCNDLDSVEIKLPEFIYTLGFVPLMNESRPSFYTSKHVNTEVARMCLRVFKVTNFWKLHRKTAAAVPARGTTLTDRKSRARDSMTKDLSQMNKHPLLGSIEIEIRPRLLVIDTNCFLDWLDSIEKIVNADAADLRRPLFTVLIPLVVLDELKGLTKSDKLKSHAIKALQYVDNGGQKARGNVKYVTSCGSVLKSSMFCEESTLNQERTGTNDDKILQTCTNLCKSDSSEIFTADDGSSKCFIRRKLVLLTADRNLRIKAMAADIPTKSVPDFVAWAKL